MGCTSPVRGDQVAEMFSEDACISPKREQGHAKLGLLLMLGSISSGRLLSVPCCGVMREKSCVACPRSRFGLL